MQVQKQSPADEIWKILKEQAQSHAQQMAEIKNSQKETNRQMKETDKKIAKLERTINKIGSGFNDRWGRLVESLVEGKLSRLLNNRGIQVLHTHPNVKRERYNKNGEVLERKEFDIIVVNGKEVVVVEVKTTLNRQEVTLFLEDNVKNFKKYFPDHKKRKLYGAVAYLKSLDSADSFAEEQGLFVIKATGDSAHIINKKNFKPQVF